MQFTNVVENTQCTCFFMFSDTTITITASALPRIQHATVYF